jgi:hypothetical protein
MRWACAASCHVWINFGVYTYRSKMVLPDGSTKQCFGHECHVPFVTWLVQDEFIDELTDAIRGGHDVAINKSREMGASWLCLAVLQWFWQYKAALTFMEMSRTEEYVDCRGDMDTLFEKHRYMLNWQPAWLKPARIKDNYMLLVNQENGSTIVGESTNGDAGRGGRKTAILLDEFAAVQNGASICAATADNSACRIFNSTPGGPGTEFSRIVEEKRARILTLPWWRHPEKAYGAKQIYDPKTGKPKWISPWYLVEEARRSKKEMAQEIDMEHAKAGDVFFDVDELDAHKKRHGSTALDAGRVEVAGAGEMGEDSKIRMIRAREPRTIRFVQAPSGPSDGRAWPWRLWIPLIDGRPFQGNTYVMGIDPATGSGDANSVISVAAIETGQKVAEFASANILPEELAEIACFAGIWFGGPRGSAFMIWENNGVGGAVGRKVVKLGYTNIYFQRTEGSVVEERTLRYGWNSSPKKKLALLVDYRQALATGRFINPSREALDEAKSYVIDEHGELLPGKLVEMLSGARANHGDRVIADALANMALKEAPIRMNQTMRAPHGSPAWRFAEYKKNRAREDEWGN